MSLRRSKIPKFIPILSLLILLVLGPIVFSLLQNASGVEAAWVDDNFSYRNAIPITSHTAAENNVYITATIDTSASGQFQADCGDLRFTTVGGDTLPYYIVSGCVSASTVVHVFFKSMPAGAQTIYYYYGNPSAANGFSSADFATVASSYALGSIASQEKGGAPIAYWKFDDGTGTNAQDSSPNNNDGTITGATWQTSDQCVSDKCLYFDGSDSNDYVSINNNSALEVQNMTLSVWIKRTNKTINPSHAAGVISKGNGANNGAYELLLSTNTYLYFRNTDLSSTSISSGYVPPLNEWVNFSLTWNGSNIVFYANGKQVGTSALTGTISYTTSNALVIGARQIVTSAANFPGYIDDVRIYNYARTAAQIKSDFKSRGTAKGVSVGAGSSRQNSDALSNGLVGYWKMDEASWNGTSNEVTDSSGVSNYMVAKGTTGTATITAGKYGNGGSFTRANGHLICTNGGSGTSCVDDNDVDITGDITVSMWLKAPSSSSTVQVPLAKYSSCGYELVTNTTGTVYFGGRAGDCGQYTASGNSTAIVYDNNWHHVVGTRKDDKLSIFIDGKLENSQTVTTTGGWSYANGGSLIIGAENTSGGNAFEGPIDEVRIYNRALSPREVRDLYNYAPGPIGYWNFEEGTGNPNDSSGNSNNGTWSGTGSHWDTGKYGKAGRFNGSSDYIDAGTNSTLGITKAITINAWIKPNSSIDGLARIYTGNGGAFGTDGVTQAWFYIDGTWRYSTNVSASVPINSWSYWSATYDSITREIKIYINGILKGTTTLSGLSTYDITLTTNNFVIGTAQSKTERFFPGSIDDVRIYNYARTQKQIVEDMNAGHPVGGSPIGSQIGYWRFDEGYGTNTSDSSSQNQNGTITGATWTNNGKFGKTLNFDGVDDVVSVADSTTLDSVSSAFTISAWIYDSDADDGTDDGRNIADKGDTGTTVNNTFIFGTSDSKYLTLTIGDGTSYQSIASTKVIPFQTWTYVTATFDGTQLKLYIDGKSVATPVTKTIGTLVNAGNLVIGRQSAADCNNPYNSCWKGMIDEVKLYSSALTEDEIKLDYNRGQAMVLGTLSDTSGLTGGSVASSSASAEYCIPGDTATCTAPVARWDFEEGSGVSANDTSGNALTGTLVNSATWASGKLGKAGDFNGASVRQGVQVSNNALLNPGTGSITTQAWIKTSQTGSWKRIVTKRGSTTTWYSMGINSGKLAFETAVSYPTYYTTGSGNKTINDGQWHHVVMVRDTAQSKVLLYVDGQLDINPSDGTVGQSITNSEIFEIGIWGTEAYDSGSYTGKIDGVKIFNYARTPAQIAWDYNRGAPVGHWRLDECQGATAKDSSGNGNNGTITIGATGTQTAVGTCTTSGTAWYNGVTGKFNSSLNFDGTDDYVSMGNTQDMATNTFAVSAWVKTSTNFSGGNVIIAAKANSGNGQQYSLQFRTTNKTAFVVANGSAANVASSNNTLNDGGWHHIVGVQNGNATSLYVDGVLNSTDSTNTVTTTSNSNNFNVARRYSGDMYYTGQIDDVRIYNYALTPLQIRLLFNGSSAVRFGPLTGSP